MFTLWAVFIKCILVFSEMFQKLSHLLNGPLLSASLVSSQLGALMGGTLCFGTVSACVRARPAARLHGSLLSPSSFSHRTRGPGILFA